MTVTFFFTFVSNIYAATIYTVDEVAKHNSPDNCWMTINKNVYDLTGYLVEHDKEMDIRSWCGKDATEDFNTKNGKGQSHSDRANSILTQYLIGSINAETPITASNSSNTNTTTKKLANKYNVIIPLLGTVLVYFLSLKLMKRQMHNLIWNTIMLLGLIPSFGFGVIMALGIRWENILYNHVELSIVFGTVCILHFLMRLNIYLAQVRTKSV